MDQTALDEAWNRTWNAVQLKSGSDEAALENLQDLFAINGGLEYALSHTGPSRHGTMTLLHWSARWGRIRCVRELHRVGMNVDEESGNGETALALATRYIQKDVKAYLTTGLKAQTMENAVKLEPPRNTSGQRKRGPEDRRQQRATPQPPQLPVPQRASASTTELQKQLDALKRKCEMIQDRNHELETQLQEREKWNRDLRAQHMVVPATDDHYNTSHAPAYDPHEEMLLDKLATCNIVDLQNALEQAEMVGITKENPIMRRCQLALARLQMQGRSISTEGSALAKARALQRLAFEYTKNPYAVHVVVIWSRFLRRSERVWGSPLETHELIQRACGQVQSAFLKNLINLKKGERNSDEESPPIEDIARFMESCCKIVPFPSEIHVMPTGGKSTKVLLYFEFDGHCLVCVSNHSALWVKYIRSAASAFRATKIPHQCDKVEEEISHLRGGDKVPDGSQPDFNIIDDGEILAKELFTHSQFYKAFRHNNETLLSPEGAWKARPEWWQVHSLVGPDQTPDPTVVINKKETVVFAYYPVYVYVKSDQLARMNPKPGCCPWNDQKGCCGCCGLPICCKLEIICQGCCDCSPTSWALGFSIVGILVFAFGLTWIVGWASYLHGKGNYGNRL